MYVLRWTIPKSVSLSLSLLRFNQLEGEKWEWKSEDEREIDISGASYKGFNSMAVDRVIKSY